MLIVNALYNHSHAFVLRVPSTTRPGTRAERQDLRHLSTLFGDHDSAHSTGYGGKAHVQDTVSTGIPTLHLPTCRALCLGGTELQIISSRKTYYFIVSYL